MPSRLWTPRCRGQWLWIDPRTETVIARQSAEADPVNDEVDRTVAEVMRAIAAHV